jgi:hypothetical protein
LVQFICTTQNASHSTLRVLRFLETMLKAGDRAAVDLDPAQLYLFAPDGRRIAGKACCPSEGSIGPRA